MQITFQAIIAATSSAFKVGDEGASRLSLDIPMSDMASAMKVMAFGRKHILNVTIDIEEAHDEQNNE
jgi:hypothetical protein